MTLTDPNGMMYFVGNVFNGDDESKTERHQPGFGFTNQQKKNVNFVGLPVRIEHNEQLRVGTVRKSWYNRRTNERWILGDIRKKDLKGTYAANGIQNSLYGGLSLQHISVGLDNGEHVMVPVEISIVEQPRRKDCNIVQFKASSTAQDTYLRTHSSHQYNLCKILIQQMNESTTKTSPSSPTSTPSVVSDTPSATPTMTHSASAGTVGADTEGPSFDELCKLVLELQTQNDNLTLINQKKQEDLTRFEAERASAMQKKIGEARNKASTLKKSIVDWCASNGVDLNDETHAKLETLANDHPDLGNVVFQITHKASQKCIELQQQIQNDDQKRKQDALKNEVKNIYSRKLQSRGPVTLAPTPATSATSDASARYSFYEASNKAKRRAPSDVYAAQNQDLIRALKRGRTGTARDNMNQIYNSLKGRY